MIALSGIFLCIAVLAGIFWNRRRRAPTDQNVNNKMNQLNRLHLERNNPK
jgi:hypothetical protein